MMKSPTSRLGLHIRMESSLLAVAQHAQELQLPFFQCFLTANGTSQIIRPHAREIAQFAQLVRQQFSAFYVHGSYWINLASLQHTGHAVFKRELALAARLGCTHMILHPGTAKGATDRLEGVDALARILNRTMAERQDVTIVLENTAHDHLAVGSDLSDLRLLLEKLDAPEQLKFCIDTAHAHAFGYDLISAQGQRSFVKLIDDTIGLTRVSLIHLNDTVCERGSLIDKHAIIGQGKLGEIALKNFVMQPELFHIPIIMVLPVMEPEAERLLVESVKMWF